jgi:type IV secretory pathway TrbF-like protein
MSTLTPARTVGSAAPRHIEIWGELEQQNRFLRRLAIAASLWAFVALAGGAYALNVGLFRPLAFHIDTDGHSTFVGRLRERSAPTEAEVRFVAKHFLQRFTAANSLTIETDLADAWNLMTDELRAQHERMLADYEREHQKEFVAFVKEQGIQMVLELKSDRTRVTDHAGKVWTVQLIGTARTWPLGRVGEEAAFTERDIEAILTLVRCPRTESTPNGLLVAKVATRFFVDEKSQPVDRATHPDSHSGATAAPVKE